MDIRTGQTSSAKVEVISNLSNTGKADASTQKFAQLLANTIEQAGLDSQDVTIQVRNGEVSVRFGENAAVSPQPAATGNPFSGARTPQFAAAPSTVTDTAELFPWSPYTGPKDFRDELPQGGGQVTASGAPLIQSLSTPLKNQYGYTGPAALNPYYCTPSNPLRSGYVAGFEKWFNQAFVKGPSGDPQPLNGCMFCTDEGAQEALRLVRQFEPSAELRQEVWGGEWIQATQPYWAVALPGNRTLNAGGVLQSYYNGGYGVTSVSDSELLRAMSI